MDGAVQSGFGVEGGEEDDAAEIAGGYPRGQLFGELAFFALFERREIKGKERGKRGKGRRGRVSGQ